MSSRVCPELSTAPVGSSQAPTAAVDNSAPYTIRSGSSYISGFTVQTNGATSEVIVGAESKVTRAQISEALGSLCSSVIIRNARLAFGSYRVTTQNDAALWT